MPSCRRSWYDTKYGPMGSVSPCIINKSVALLNSSLSVVMSPMRFWEMTSFCAVDNTAPNNVNAKPT